MTQSAVSLAADNASVDPEFKKSVVFQLDEGGDQLIFRVQYSDGTYKSGVVALTTYIP